VALLPRKAGAEGDRQLWRLERWIERPLGIGNGFLAEDFNDNAVLFMLINGNSMLYAGGQPEAGSSLLIF
jgi:hypothetical protein